MQSDPGCTADGHDETDSKILQTVNRGILTYTLMGYSTQHVQIALDDFTPALFHAIGAGLMSLNRIERTDRHIIDAHNYAVVGLLDAFAEAVRRNGPAVFAEASAANEVVEATTANAATNSQSIMAAMNIITSRVGQDNSEQNQINGTNPALMLLKNGKTNEGGPRGKEKE